tara:strand:- start:953 stop:1660 length:708 start_codon:yes stop_codon:yes gene_type:complete
MSKYFINILACIGLLMSLNAQEAESEIGDSIVVKQKYGLRLGVDLSKITRSLTEKDYMGFEINGDYRLSKNLYIAGEIGSEKKTSTTNYLNSTAEGTYLKVGVDYNMYTNWAGMDNLIYSGMRIGITNFNQTLNSYTIYDTNSLTWGENQVVSNNNFSALSSGWIEIILGVKTEVLNNLFLGFNLQIKGRVFETNINNFENIYIPGFGRTYDSGKFGMGFGYSISYLVPMYRKAK